MSTSSPDFVTIDVLPRPPGGNLRWRRRARTAFAQRPAGLRSVTVNHANDGTHSLLPGPVPGSALVAAWESADAAAQAWDGRLRGLFEGARDLFSLDSEVVRVRVENEGDDWHGWLPSAEGSAALSGDEPMVAVVHGIVHPRHLAGFVHDNMHAASRAAHHPGHRGSVDVSSQLPFEHTSISLWRTTTLARDFAYAPGGHTPAVRHVRENGTHRVGCFLQLRPLASTGRLGLDEPAFEALPPARRTSP